MSLLRNKHDAIPNGFQFFQPQTNWNVPDPWRSFDSVVQQITEHRRANPRFELPTDYDTVARELEIFNVERLRGMPGTEHFLVSGEPGPPASFPKALAIRPRASAEAGVAAGVVAKVSTGISTIIGWIGSGLKPAPVALATSRAEVCSTCEFNVPEGVLAGAAGDALKSIMDARAQMKLSTPFDDKLGVCNRCDCSLKAKVFAPMEHIQKGHAKEVADSLPAWCWIKRQDDFSPTWSEAVKDIPKITVPDPAMAPEPKPKKSRKKTSA